MTAFGTVGAVVAALFIAVWADWRTGRRLQQEREEADRRLRREQEHTDRQLQEERELSDVRLMQERQIAHPSVITTLTAAPPAM